MPDPFDTLQRERAKFGATIFPWDAVRILNAVAWIHRDALKLVSAPRAGNGWDHPNGFIRIGHLADVLAAKVIDVFEDGPDKEPVRAGPSRPTWSIANQLAGIGTVSPVQPDSLLVPGEPVKPIDETEPSGEVKPGEPETELEVIAALLPLFESVVAALTANATETKALRDKLEQVRAEGVRVRLR